MRAILEPEGAVDHWYCLIKPVAWAICPPHAEDIIQDTYLDLLRSRKTPASVKDLTAFVRGIARKKGYSIIRREARHQKAEFDIGELAAMTGTDGELEIAERRDKINRAVLDLSPEQREIVRLRHMEGLSYAEVGAALGLKAGTVRWKWSVQIRPKLIRALADIAPPR